jgi:hypothetical protein
MALPRTITQFGTYDRKVTSQDVIDQKQAQKQSSIGGRGGGASSAGFTNIYGQTFPTRQQSHDAELAERKRRAEAAEQNKRNVLNEYTNLLRKDEPSPLQRAVLTKQEKAREEQTKQTAALTKRYTDYTASEKELIAKEKEIERTRDILRQGTGGYGKKGISSDQAWIQHNKAISDYEKSYNKYQRSFGDIAMSSKESSTGIILDPFVARAVFPSTPTAVPEKGLSGSPAGSWAEVSKSYLEAEKHGYGGRVDIWETPKGERAVKQYDISIPYFGDVSLGFTDIKKIRKEEGWWATQKEKTKFTAPALIWNLGKGAVKFVKSPYEDKWTIGRTPVKRAETVLDPLGTGFRRGFRQSGAYTKTESDIFGTATAFGVEAAGITAVTRIGSAPKVSRVRGSTTVTETSGLMDITTAQGKRVKFKDISVDSAQQFKVKYKDYTEDLFVDIKGKGAKAEGVAPVKSKLAIESKIYSKRGIDLPADLSGTYLKEVGRSRAIIKTETKGIRKTRLGKAISQESTVAEVFQVKQGKKTVSGKRRIDVLSDVIPIKQPKPSGVTIKDYEGLLFDKRGYVLSKGFKPKDVLTDFKGVGAYRSAKLGKKTITESVSVFDVNLPKKIKPIKSATIKPKINKIKLFPVSKKGQVSLLQEPLPRPKLKKVTKSPTSLQTELENIGSNLAKQRAKLIYRTQPIELQLGRTKGLLGLTGLSIAQNVQADRGRLMFDAPSKSRLKASSKVEQATSILPLTRQQDRNILRFKPMQTTKAKTITETPTTFIPITPPSFKPITPVRPIPPPFIPPLPALDFTGRRRKGRTKVKNLYGYTADFTSAVLGIKRTGKMPKGYIFSGFERRGL